MPSPALPPGWPPLCAVLCPSCAPAPALQMTVAFTSLVVLFVVERLSERGGTLALLPALAAGVASVAYWRSGPALPPRLGLLRVGATPRDPRDKCPLLRCSRGIGAIPPDAQSRLRMPCTMTAEERASSQDPTRSAGASSLARSPSPGAVRWCVRRLTDDLRPYLLVQFVPLLLLPALALLSPAKYSHSALWLAAAACYAAAKLAEVGDGVVFRLSGAAVSGHTVKHLLAAAVPVYLLLMLHRRALLAERVSELERWGWGRGRGQERAGEAAGTEGRFGDEEQGAAPETTSLLSRGSSSDTHVS